MAGNKETGDDLDLFSSGSSTTTGDTIAQPPAGAGRNYYEVAAEYLTKYLEFQPTDAGALLRLGSAYLFNLNKCTEGVATFEKLLAVEPNNCIAKRSLGYAYFGENLCQKNYGKALGYFKDAYECLSKEGPCKDATLILWIAQCYHLRAAANTADKPASKADFKAANEWYHKVLKCEPGNSDAKKGVDDTRFEF